MNRTVWKWILAVSLLAAAVVGASRLPTRDWIDAAREPLLRAGAWGALLYGAAYVVAALLLIPGSVLTLGAGALFGWKVGAALVWLSSTATAALAFLLARTILRRRVLRWIDQSPRLSAVDRAIGEEGAKLVALLRLSPAVPFTLFNYLCGVTSVRFGSYLLASSVAMLPGTFLYVSVGALGASALGREEVAGWVWAMRIAGLVATVIVTWLLTRIARKAIGQRLAEPAPPARR